jgi:RNA-directed DNA polymerase
MISGELCGMDKTRLVYCKDQKRRGEHAHTRFDFLGFSFHARTVQDREGRLFTGFNPGVSRNALKRMSQALRQANINRSTRLELKDLAARINPMVSGWIAYYGQFYPHPLKRALSRIDLRLGRWARNKYKRLRGHKRRSWEWLKEVRSQLPHTVCSLGIHLLVRLAEKSRMNREVHGSVPSSRPPQ